MGTDQDAEAGERDRAWFEAIFRLHHPALLAYARRRVPDPDDLVAEVFVTAWRHCDRVPDDPLPWLYRVAAHSVLHVRRAGSRRDRLARRVAASLPATSHPDPADAVGSALDDRIRVRTALATLSERDQEVLRLSVWEQLDPAQIAYVMSCSESAARVRLHRARRRFAAALGDQPATELDSGTSTSTFPAVAASLRPTSNSRSTS